jgi:hypothetical protein
MQVLLQNAEGLMSSE